MTICLGIFTESNGFITRFTYAVKHCEDGEIQKIGKKTEKTG